MLYHLTVIVLASWAWQIPDGLDHDRGGRGNQQGMLCSVNVAWQSSL